MKKTALIMAGGKGERFWPKSRMNLPKQFLSLTGDGRTMIQLTVERILPLVAAEDIFIATNEDYRELLAEQLPDIPKENIIYEPVSRNTAPCVGLGAVHIAKKYDDALMIVLPSDHLIKEGEKFLEVLDTACRAAGEDKNLLTMGIKPVYPETGYGYICYDADSEKDGVYPVERFVEKPNLEKAQSYLEAGNYLWNSGMFVWKCSSILADMKEFMPDLYQGLMNIKSSLGTEKEDEVVKNEFMGFTSQSIDYGIMEKAEHICTIPGDFGWDDVGSWLAVERLQGQDDNGNTTEGNAVLVNCEDCLIQGGRRLIAGVGLKNLIIVETADAILICDKESTNDIKNVLSVLKEEGRDEYL